MACFEQLSPSSVLSPLTGMDIDSSYSNPAESNAGVVVASSAARSSPSLKRALSSASTSSTSKDGSATRGSKRRKSRAKPKAPITQLSANKLNFRDIVHQFTGAPSSKPPFTSCRPHMPSITQNNGAVCDYQQMPSALAHASLSEKDALLAGALLAQSLRTLDTISSYLLQPKSSSAAQDAIIASTSCSGEHVDNAHRPDFLLKGDSKLDSFFSLSCLLLNRIASQCGALS